MSSKTITPLIFTHFQNEMNFYVTKNEFLCFSVILFMINSLRNTCIILSLNVA